MASKTVLFLGLVLALILLISSQAMAARDLEETSNKSEEPENTNEAEVNDAKYGGYPGGGYGGNPGGGYGGNPGRGGGYGGYPGRGGGYGGYPGRGGGYGGYPGRGGYCRFGCCGRSYYGGGRCRCCAYQGQQVEAEPQS